MSEDRESKNADEESSNGKDIAFYSALVNAWIGTRMEKDKTLIAISAGGIGLLVGLLKTSASLTPAELVLYFVAICAFLLTIIAAVFVFTRNAKHLEDVVVNGFNGSDPILDILDQFVTCSFIVALIMSVIIGCVEGFNKLEIKGDAVSREIDNVELVPSELMIRPEKTFDAQIKKSEDSSTSHLESEDSMRGAIENQITTDGME